MLKRLVSAAALLVLGSTTASCRQPTLDDLWNGRARLEQVGDLNYGGLHPDGVPISSAGWYAVSEGRWFAFSRAVPSERTAGCTRDITKVVVSESKDKGRTWSAPVTAVRPGASQSGDHCAVVDGSTFYDSATGTWHMLAQCLDRDDRPDWALCHYTRKSKSPVGSFAADPANPVVRAGQLWSRVCAGVGKSCPAKVIDEGTPDIVEKRGGRFIVTVHGFDGKNGYRTVASTADFRSWMIEGGELANDAILTPAECRHWLKGCVGFGQATATRSGERLYVVAEAMDGSLLCQENQIWTFALLRSKYGEWPRSGRGEWELFRQTPLLKPSKLDPKTRCQVAYARWLIDGSDTYLIYEDWAPRRKRVYRRLLKLVHGEGPAVRLQ